MDKSEDPTIDFESSAASFPAESLPERIGRYRILGEIGEGGFGVVYEAEQTEPVTRRVALKVIKLGMDTKQVIARFEAERQALAMMDHPHIAKVLDAGATETGRPFFVMEIVRGDPITEYCDKQNLAIEERLRLFQQVCGAVQHAHQKGVIHRDIKPSNVLVTMHDGKPSPKVIDFGIAKATSSRLTEKTVFTQQQQLIGTPEYMSPEQAEMSGIDIDTRSDIYSLGVLLYELLTGVTPFDAQTLRSAAFGEIQRLIREQTPPKPSTRLSSLDTVEKVAQSRHTEPRKLGVLIRGDLDWIVMKALEKDRTRRYETANGFAADIQRYLVNEPVDASPPSVGYKLRKFVRRNKAGVVAASVVGVALVLGMIGTTWGMTRAIEAAEAEAAARQEAEQLADFQAGMLEQVDPATAGVRLTADVIRRYREALAEAGAEESEIALRVDEFRAQWRRFNATDAALALIDETMLGPAVEAIDRQFADQPLVDARLRQVMATRYFDLGLVNKALPLQDRALEIRRRMLGDEHADTIASMNERHFFQTITGRLDDSEAQVRSVMETARRTLGDEHRETLDAISNMARLLTMQGRLDEAEVYHREVLEASRHTLGDVHEETLGALDALAQLITMQGRLDEAEVYAREAMEGARRTLGEEHIGTLISIANMGYLLGLQGRLDEAEVYLREGLEVARRTLGDEHPETLSRLGDLGFLLRDLGRLDEAEVYLREVLEASRRTLGDEHPQTAIAINSLGLLMRDIGRLDEAEEYFRAALEVVQRASYNDPGFPLAVKIYLGGVLTERGKHDEAIELLASIESTVREMFTGGNAFRAATLLATLGRARAGLDFDADRFALAEENLLEAHAMYIDTYGEEDVETSECAAALADLYTTWDEAEPGAGYDTKASAWRERAEAASD